MQSTTTMRTNSDLEKLYWLPIDELQNTNLVPEFLRTALTNIPEEIVHIISKEEGISVWNVAES